jgi:hypothetical protein
MGFGLTPWSLPYEYATYTCTKCKVHQELRKEYPYMDNPMILKDLEPDQQAELDKMIKEATDVLTRGGVTYDPEKVREMMTKRLTEAKGWAAPAAKPTAKKAGTKPEAPPEKVVSVNDGEKKLTTDAVEKALEEGEAYWYEKKEDDPVPRPLHRPAHEGPCGGQPAPHRTVRVRQDRGSEAPGSAQGPAVLQDGLRHHHHRGEVDWSPGD